MQYQLCLLRHRFKPIYELKESEFAELVGSYKSIFDTFAEKRREQAAEVEQFYFDFGAYLDDLESGKWKSFSPQVYAIFWQLEL